MYTRFEQLFFNYFEQFKRLQEATPLVLGGVSGAGGGTGGRPGGFVGTLPQVNVSYDTTESESLYLPESGASLVDNLNHIRYRISFLEDTLDPLYAYEDGVLVASGITIIDFLTDDVIETSPGHITISGNKAITFIELTDTPNTYAGQANKFNTVKGDETGLEFITISGGIDTFKTKVSSDDTTEDFLENKIEAGDGIDLAVTSPGGNEKLQITSLPKVKVSSDDTTEDYLENKIIGGDNVSIATISGGSNEHLEIQVSSIPWQDISSKPYRVMTFGYIGALTAKTLEARLHAPFSGTIVNVTATVNTEPAGSSIILDVLKNSTSIFTTSGNRPTIPAGQKNDLSSTPDVTSFNLDDIFTVSVDQIGSTTAGSDLVLQIRCDV